MGLAGAGGDRGREGGLPRASRCPSRVGFEDCPSISFSLSLSLHLQSPTVVFAGVGTQLIYYLKCVSSLCLSTQRALPTETKVESGTSQSKGETSVNLKYSETFTRWGCQVPVVLLVYVVN